MAAKRNTYKYRYKKANKVLHSGITDDLERREKEHQRRWPGGHIVQVGRRTTRAAAEEWERRQKKA